MDNGIMSSLHPRNDTSDLELLLNELKQLNDLNHTVAKLNSLSGDSAANETFDGHGDRPNDWPPPVHRHNCTHKDVNDRESEAILNEIKMLWIIKKNMLNWLRWLDNTINGRSIHHALMNKNLQGIYSDERQTLLTLIYKIPYKYDLVHTSHNKEYYCTQYTTFVHESRDVHCRVTIYDNVRSVLNEMSTWKMRFRTALDSTQQVEYDSLYNEAKQSAESWMSVAVPRMATQALAHSRASQVSV